MQGQTEANTINAPTNNEKWMFADPIHALCLATSGLSGSEQESYGAALVLQTKSGQKILAALAWNHFAGTMNFPTGSAFCPRNRQGYSNHSEGGVGALGESMGFDYKHPNLTSTIFVAGFTKNGRYKLFVNPDEVPFTCTRCTHFLTELGVGHLVTPRRYGWQDISMEQAQESAEAFKDMVASTVDQEREYRNGIHREEITEFEGELNENQIYSSSEKLLQAIDALEEEGYLIFNQARHVAYFYDDLLRLPKKLRTLFLSCLGSPYFHVSRRPRSSNSPGHISKSEFSHPVAPMVVEDYDGLPTVTVNALHSQLRLLKELERIGEYELMERMIEQEVISPMLF